MRAPPNLDSRISPWRSVARAAQNPLKRLLVLHIAMCVPIFSFIGLNAAKIDLSKVVYKNTQRNNLGISDPGTSPVSILGGASSKQYHPPPILLYRSWYLRKQLQSDWKNSSKGSHILLRKALSGGAELGGSTVN